MHVLYPFLFFQHSAYSFQVVPPTEIMFDNIKRMSSEIPDRTQTCPQTHTTGDQEAFLCELDSLKFKYTLSRTGKLHLTKSLPIGMSVRIPEKYIPESVLAMYKQHRSGHLTKSTQGAARLHDKTKMLRRYRLISPTQRVKPTPAQRRVQNREYLRAWRRNNGPPVAFELKV